MTATAILNIRAFSPHLSTSAADHNVTEPLQRARVRNRRTKIHSCMLALVVLSVCAILGAFAISVYAAEIRLKALDFLALLIIYLSASILIFWKYDQNIDREAVTTPFVLEADEHLRVLDEAAEFFAGSLTTADTFRLITSRMADLIRCSGITLLLLGENRDEFVVTQTAGIGHEKGSAFPLDSGVVGECLVERDVTLDRLANIAAVPLRRDAEVFGVLMLHFDSENDTANVDTSLLDAIGEKAAALLLASIAYERSRRNALTDAATELPNERAFHLVLENQVAEALRRGGDRPLTILSFDIRNREDVSSRFGHVAGDRVLNFVASSVKDNLRQMDFLARGRGDEFLALMPTASKEISQEIIMRIQASFFGKKVKVADIDAVEIEISFGSASFGPDGDTPAALLSVARERKEQSKSTQRSSVLWFPEGVAH